MADDFFAAGDWLAEQPLGPKYDSSVAAFAKKAAAYNPEAARVWAKEISNAQVREEILNAIAEIEEPR